VVDTKPFPSRRGKAATSFRCVTLVTNLGRGQGVIIRLDDPRRFPAATAELVRRGPYDPFVGPGFITVKTDPRERAGPIARGCWTKGDVLSFGAGARPVGGIPQERDHAEWRAAAVGPWP